MPCVARDVSADRVPRVRACLFSPSWVLRFDLEADKWFLSYLVLCDSDLRVFADSKVTRRAVS